MIFLKATFFFLIVGICSCESRPLKTERKSAKVAEVNVEIQKPFTTADSVIVSWTFGEEVYSKKRFNQIVEYFPALYDDFPYDPEISYYASGIWKTFLDSGGKEETISFGSEAGQDEYYLLYAYFLKQKNGIDSNQIRRTKLISLYSNLNGMFGMLKYGGTYFGHQVPRIEAYAEYALYAYQPSLENPEKTYSIKAQKELYILSLRQIIKDEYSLPFPAPKEEQAAWLQKLNAIVDEIEATITDKFYLNRAQEFQYRHYEYL